MVFLFVVFLLVNSANMIVFLPQEHHGMERQFLRQIVGWDPVTLTTKKEVRMLGWA